MTTDELRRAAELAGLEVYRENVSRPWMVLVPDWGGLHLANPAAETYIASRLVGMVRERERDCQWGFYHSLMVDRWSADAVTATDEQRIRAAYKVIAGKELGDATD